MGFELSKMISLLSTRTEDDSLTIPLLSTGTEDDSLVVVALDFGTTYSGYAFSFRNKPSVIYANHEWDSGNYKLSSQKTPTCILKSKENADEYSFGYQAENEYADILNDKEGHKYFFFDRFKMDLHSRKDVSDEMMIYDIRGESLPAIDIFSLAIKSLKDHFLEHNKRTGSAVRMDEIKWVLTVPAIWTDKAKSFMRMSAEKAGIKSEKLCIALEPEAASLFCQHDFRNRVDESGMDSNSSILKQGTKYVVVDIGGGTVDITAHEKVIHDKVRELCEPSGAACGGTSVDKAFMNMLEDIVGTTVMEKLKTEFTMGYFDLIRGFEALKRNISSRKRTTVHLQIPVAALNNICQQEKGKSFDQILTKSEKYKDKLVLKSDKLQMEKTFVKSLFKTTTDKIIEEIQMTLRQVGPNDVHTLLLVGGVSSSDIVYEAIKQAFPDKQVLTPTDPFLAIVKGAVLFGQTPDFVSSRYTRFAYGRRIRPLFDETKHDISRRIPCDQEYRCRDVFDIFMEKNKDCPTGTICRKQYHTTEKMQAKITVAVYVAKNNDTKYVDDDECEKLGELVVDIPTPTPDRQLVDAEFHFGGTELLIKATHLGSGQKCQGHFQLI